MWVTWNYSFTKIKIENWFFYYDWRPYKLSFHFIFMLLDKINRSNLIRKFFISPKLICSVIRLVLISREQRGRGERVAEVEVIRNNCGKHHFIIFITADLIFSLLQILHWLILETSRWRKKRDNLIYQNVFMWRQHFVHSIWFDHLF